MRVGGIVLAAGGSARFGSPKQLAPLDGRPLLEHTLAAMAHVPALAPRVVVLGAHADEILDEVDLHGARPVDCGDWTDGQSASLRTGLDALGDVDAALIVLGDQPRVTPQVIAMLLDHAPGPARAVYDGAPGHPVVLPRALFGAARSLHGDRGARDLLAGAREIEAGHLCSAHDIDTPADLERI